MRILGLIPARGGSKGIPRKNVVDLAGRPLLAWTVEPALASGVLERVVVSTDDEEIAAVALRWGAEAPFRRPRGLAGDQTSSEDVVRHALAALAESEYRPDAVMLLQPTSPLRSDADIVAAAELLAGAGGVVSVRAVMDHPALLHRIENGSLRRWGGDGEPPGRRQDHDALFVPNGAIFAARTPGGEWEHGWYGPDSAAYVMPAERSIDIDTPWDMRVAALVLGAS